MYPLGALCDLSRTPVIQGYYVFSLSSQLWQNFVAVGSHFVVAVFASVGMANQSPIFCGGQRKAVDGTCVRYTIFFGSKCIRLSSEYFVWSKNSSEQPHSMHDSTFHRQHLTKLQLVENDLQIRSAFPWVSVPVLYSFLSHVCSVVGKRQWAWACSFHQDSQSKRRCGIGCGVISFRIEFVDPVRQSNMSGAGGSHCNIRLEGGWSVALCVSVLYAWVSGCTYVSLCFGCLAT